MVLGKLQERPTNLDNSRARAYCVCGRYGWHVSISFLYSVIFSSFSLLLDLVGWLLWVYGPLIQYFSLYRAVFHREGDRKEK